jgi:hypothetical protein
MILTISKLFGASTIGETGENEVRFSTTRVDTNSESTIFLPFEVKSGRYNIDHAK